MVLSVARFNAQLAVQGQNMTWARASNCPCRSIDVTGSPKPDCNNCDGAGVFWAAPVPCIAGLSGQQVQRQWTAGGQYKSGDVVVSIPSNTPLYDAGEFDRVMMVNSSESVDYIEVFGEERARAPWISVDTVFYVDELAQEVTQCTLPTVNADGSLTWSTDPAAVLPAQGQQYTIQGRAQLEFFVFQGLVQDRAHYGGLALPRKVALRRFALFGRTE